MTDQEVLKRIVEKIHNNHHNNHSITTCSSFRRLYFSNPFCSRDPHPLGPQRVSAPVRYPAGGLGGPQTPCLMGPGAIYFQEFSSYFKSFSQTWTTYLGDEIKSPFHAVSLFLKYFHNINITRFFCIGAHNCGYSATAFQFFFRLNIFFC